MSSKSKFKRSRKYKYFKTVANTTMIAGAAIMVTAASSGATNMVSANTVTSNPRSAAVSSANNHVNNVPTRREHTRMVGASFRKPTKIDITILPKLSEKEVTVRHNLKRWGVEELPVSESRLKKYGFGKKNLKDLIVALKWAEQPKVRHIRNVESGGRYTINTGNGHYGAYQFAYGTWLANGGGRFSQTADKAPSWAQDFVAYKTWKQFGWQPWGG